MAYVLPPELQSLLAHWLVRREDRPIPDRRDVPLRELTAWYDHLAIIDIAAYGDLRRYAFAFCGQALHHRLGREAMKLELRDLDKPVWVELLKTLERGHEAPAIGYAPAARRNGTIVTYCDLVLPLSDRSSRATQLLMGSYAVAHHAGIKA
ncbi:MAG TPA: hypothetical protein VGG48_06590 [Rhizomicrobium sp.]|jgi:hypothetical protein